MKSNFTRRDFLGSAVGVAAGLTTTGRAIASSAPKRAAGAGLAILGGSPVRTKPFPSWPVIEQNDEKGWMQVLMTGKWNRLDGHFAHQFETAWARLLGAKYGLATASGTTALLTSANALGIGPGDEVIVPPYTFVATVNIVLLQHALPVFVDTDPETFQIDARKVEAAITKRTRCIIPVHLGGSAADMDAILDVAKRHKLFVIEDACQAHLAEWRHKKVSTLGNIGCFSFQASKNLNSGEGGAILTNGQDLYEYCLSFHNQGRGRYNSGFGYVRNGANFRMTEFQGALLLQQLTRLEAQSRKRTENAEYLTNQLKQIPGISPARMYGGCTRNAYHLYMFHYDSAHFAGLPRSRFLKALDAEGVPASSGYIPLNKEPFLKEALGSRAFKAIYTQKELSGYEERNHCPENDELCERAVWFTQTMFLGPRSDMDQIAEAIRKIQKQAGALVRSQA
jgi:dTDP-4-amino-4,6-dideoxygalactose transaminase